MNLGEQARLHAELFQERVAPYPVTGMNCRQGNKTHSLEVLKMIGKNCKVQASNIPGRLWSVIGKL